MAFIFFLFLVLPFLSSLIYSFIPPFFFPLKLTETVLIVQADGVIKLTNEIFIKPLCLFRKPSICGF